MDYRQFSSKLLLFGEYTVLVGSDALAVPFHHFSGRFEFSTKYNDPSGGVATLFHHVAESPELLPLFDTGLWSSDLKNRLYFASDIPIGYGLGSSGALVAAAYDRYCIEKTTEVALVKDILALMENAFHGSSSGMDPLVSWLNMPTIFKNNGDIVTLPPFPLPASIALLDTGLARQTGPLVARFKSNLTSDTSFRGAIENVKTNNQEAIAALISGNTDALRAAFREISALQLDNLPSFIPSPFEALWKSGLENDLFYLKLCGAGGGGMLMVYFVTEEGKSDLMNEYSILKIDL